MIDLPSWLDYAYNENAAMAISRRLRGLSASWGELIASAQSIMGFYQEVSIEEIEALYSESNVLPLIAAARILDAASQQKHDIAPEERSNLALVAGVAFAMYGNAPSATAVLRDRFIVDVEITSELSALIGTAAPALIGKMLLVTRSGTPFHNYLSKLESFLRSGDENEMASVRNDYVECLLGCQSSFLSALYRSGRVCLEHLLRLSVARNLKSQTLDWPEGYVSRLVDRGVKVLLPPQFIALRNNRLAERDDNALVALPTSAGKTLLGEICLVSALHNSPGIACYLAPYVALGNQVADSLESHLPSPIRVHRMIGGFEATDTLYPDHYQEVVVATPERLDALCRAAPQLMADFRCVICDEAHLLESGVRGILLEGLLSRLRLLQSKGQKIKLVLLSAVLSQYEHLQRWLAIPDDAVIVDTWKPTARRIAFWKGDGSLTWYAGDDPIRRPGVTSESSLGQLALPWPETGFYPERYFGRDTEQTSSAYNNVAYLIEFLLRDYGGPILCACASKAGTRRAARAVAARLPRLEPIPQSIGNAVARIETRYSFLLPMCELLRRGVAFHNATVPHDVRRLIERAIQDRELKVVSSTTTLAEGVDLPFRFTVLVDWLSWSDAGQVPMSSLLFRNVAGRCGRAGVFTEGDTIVFDNPVGDPRYTFSYDKWSIQSRVFLAEKPEGLRSTISKLLRNGRSGGAYAALASQFMAAVPENPMTDDLIGELSRNTFFYHSTGDDSQLRGLFTQVQGNLLDERNGALAVMESPLRLTTFGRSANATGFSPDSCRRIVSSLRGESAGGTLAIVGSTLLGQLGSLPEQPNGDLRKVLTKPRSRFCVKPADLDEVLTAWLNGDALQDIFVGLPYVLRSKRRPTVTNWLSGEQTSATWDAEFDGFVEFMTSAVSGFLPWLMRACGQMAEFLSEWAAGVNWRQAGQLVEKGVGNPWALSAITAGATARKGAVLVGRRWPESLTPPWDPFYVDGQDGRAEIEQLFRDVLAEWESVPAYVAQISEMRIWLKQFGGLNDQP